MTDQHEREEGTSLLLDFDRRGGFLPVVVQDADSLEVLMLAWTNREALEISIRTRRATFWSTSRGELWVKGQSSGDFLEILEIRVDCDQDALVYRVRRLGGGVCHTRDPHTGLHRPSCFYRRLNFEGSRLEFLKAES